MSCLSHYIGTASIPLLWGRGVFMKKLSKRHWFIILFSILLLGLSALLIFSLSSAKQLSGDEMTEQELYDAYSHENDPAHPVLDVKVSLQISNLGSRPGASRPQNLALEYPKTSTQTTETPTLGQSVPLNPNIVTPGVTPNLVLPNVTLPDFYIINPTVLSPQFTGGSFTLSWKYTGGRKVTYNVLISTDKGSHFTPLKDKLTADNYTLTFPDTTSNHCILRVAAMMDGRVYKTADTSEFALVTAPVAAPPPIANYVDPQVKYFNLPSLRISSESGLPIWFNAENRAENATKLIWQLSSVPFIGTAESFGQENGILSSGQVALGGGEFSVDLKALCDELAKPDANRSSGTPFLSKRSVYEFYMRVVALDASGKCIGDPGRGLGFSYGAPEISDYLQSTSFADNSPIKIMMQMPVPYTSYQYTWERISPDVYNANLGKVSDMVLFSGAESQEASEIIQKAVRVELQVATSPFTNANALGLAQPKGLVYSNLDTAPDIGESLTGYSYLTPYFHGIEYSKFVPSKEELDAMGGIYYYVRGIFYVPDAKNPSVLHPYPSETLTIAFRVTSASQNTVKKVTVKSNIPYVQFYDYYPIQWQHPNSDEYYEVARHINAKEMNFSIKCADGFRIPDYNAAMLSGWTLESYQDMLDERLPVGAVIHYVKAEPGFWDEFFSLLNSIYSGVSNAYANAKASVVSLVDFIPLIGDDARAYLKAAATYAIDYGLMSIGLPPTLPNIDQLAEGGMDYIMKVAVDEALQAAGVPIDSPAAKEITEKVRKEVAGEVTGELEKAILAQNQNPLKAGFLRLDTSKLYQPAYVDVFVCNYSKTRATRSGQVFVVSGNGFEIYKTRAVAIPALRPGEHVTIRIYLDHLRNKYDGYNKYFDQIYLGNSGKPYKLKVYTEFILPDVNEAAKTQGLKAAPLPYVTEFTYDHDAYSYRYEREFIPAEGIYESDPEPNTQDFLD